ncbi:MAG: PLP-dependent aminotransferase family protein [Woeseiaceae bacterium]
MSLYETLAQQIESMIVNRSLRYGDRLPSVRALSKSRGVSSTTVLEAFRLLESRDLIEARPRSGYYVAFRPDPENYRMEPRGWLDPAAIHLSDTMPQILREVGNEKYLNLSAANPDPELLPVKALGRITREILRTQGGSITSYGDPQGAFALRRRIVDLMLDRGAAVNISDITITNGCQEALFLAFSHSVAPDSVVAVETPCYPGAMQVLDYLNHDVIEIPSHSHTGMDLDSLRKAASTHKISACYVMPRCSNPLGSSMPTDSLTELYGLACEYDFTLVEDDTNWGLKFNANDSPALKSLDTEQRVIYCSSFSKSIAPALRIGWIIAERATEEIVETKYTIDMGCVTLPQLIVARYLAEKRFHKDLARMRVAHADTVQNMVSAIRIHFPSGTTPILPAGGFTVWTELPETVDGNALRERALEANISIAPGTIFSSKNQYVNYLRLGWGGHWRAAVENGLKTLGDLCEEQVKPP